MLTVLHFNLASTRCIHHSKMLLSYKLEHENIRLQTHSNTPTPCIYIVDWCLTPVKVLILSKVWTSFCGLSLWSDRVREARLVLRDSQVSTHTSGIKGDFNTADKGGEQTLELELLLSPSWHLYLTNCPSTKNLGFKVGYRLLGGARELWKMLK